MIENKTIDKARMRNVEVKGYLSWRHETLTCGKWADYYTVYNNKEREIIWFESRMDLSARPLGFLDRDMCNGAVMQLVNRRHIKISNLKLEHSGKVQPSSALLASPESASALGKWRKAFEDLGCRRRGSITGSLFGAALNPSLSRNFSEMSVTSHSRPESSILSVTAPRHVQSDTRHALLVSTPAGEPASTPASRSATLPTALLTPPPMPQSASAKQKTQEHSQKLPKAYQTWDALASQSARRGGSQTRVSANPREMTLLRSRSASPPGLADTKERSSFIARVGHGLRGLLTTFFHNRASKEELEHLGVLKRSQMFGIPLLRCLRVHGVPRVLYHCIEHLRTCGGVHEEGIFRVPGGFAAVANLKKQFDYGESVDLRTHTKDPHAVAGVMKLFLREMPEPLITFKLYNQLLSLARAESFNTMRVIVEKALPVLHLITFRFLFQFLREVTQFNTENKMTSKNLAIVFAPNILRPAKETLAMMQNDAKDKISVVRALIEAFPAIRSPVTSSFDDTPEYSAELARGDAVDRKHRSSFLLAPHIARGEGSGYVSRFGIAVSAQQDVKTRDVSKGLEPPMADTEGQGTRVDAKLFTASSLFSSQRSLCRLLRAGGQFKKFKNAAATFSRGEKRRRVWCCVNLSRVLWGEKDRSCVYGYIESVDIVTVRETAKRGIRVTTTHRTLDLEATTDAMRARWIAALKWLQRFANREIAALRAKFDMDAGFRQAREAAARNALSTLTSGQIFAKYKAKSSSKRSSHSRLIWCDSKMSKLHWSEIADKSKVKNSIDTIDICSVLIDETDTEGLVRYSIKACKRNLELGDVPGKLLTRGGRGAPALDSRDSEMRASFANGCAAFIDALFLYLDFRDVFFDKGSKYSIV